MSKRKPSDDRNDTGENVIARNKRARFQYEVIEKYEAGIALTGSEVKSLRNRDVSINEAFARPRNGELWVLGMNIKPYPQANIRNHEPRGNCFCIRRSCCASWARPRRGGIPWCL